MQVEGFQTPQNISRRVFAARVDSSSFGIDLIVSGIKVSGSRIFEMTAAAGMDMIEAEMRCPAICGKLGRSRKLVPAFEAPCIAITRSFSSTKIRREKECFGLDDTAIDNWNIGMIEYEIRPGSAQV
jgi:hypothetical protein